MGKETVEAIRILSAVILGGTLLGHAMTIAWNILKKYLGSYMDQCADSHLSRDGE